MPPFGAQNPEDGNRIEELKESLYSRTAPPVRSRRKLRFSDEESTVQKGWERKEDADARPKSVLTKSYEDHSMSFFTKLFIGSAVFFIVALGIGTYLFFKGANLISADNIDIQISGPVSIPGGEPVKFDIKVINRNNVDLQVVDMSVDFPDGTTDPTDPTKELKTFREVLGDIPAGRSASKSVEAIIFGEENLQKQINVTATYSVKGSTSVFTKTKGYDVLIKSSPINATIDSFTEVTSGQEFEMKVSVKSNSPQTLKNVLMKASYPFGFTFISSDIKPLTDNATWRIGDVPPGGERKITIRGKIQGEDGDLRVFRFAVGAQSSLNSQTIGTEYMALEHHMTIEKPFVSLRMSFENDEGNEDYVASFEDPIRVRLEWFNNLPVSVSNMQITAKITGNAYAASGVEPESGLFRSATGEIVWNQQTNSELRSAGAGESGSVTFTVIPKDKSTARSLITNPGLLITASVSGNRTQESRVPESLSSVASRAVRVASVATLTGRIVRTIGPFTNGGPIPPKADNATTYTVIWTVDNTTSLLSNAQVTATLPAYVKWTGSYAPSKESIVYEPNSGTVTWNVGNVETHTLASRGTGVSARREVMFQISFEPGINQVGESPVLVNRTTLSATDDYTRVRLESVQESLTTRFSTDPSYREGYQNVVN